MRILYLYDFTNNKVYTPIDLDNLDDVKELSIKVISGDEILNITYTDGETNEIDSSMERELDFFDGSYILYSKQLGINNLEAFMVREDSYTLLKNKGVISMDTNIKYKMIDYLKSARRQVKEMNRESFTTKEVCEILNDLIKVISQE